MNADSEPEERKIKTKDGGEDGKEEWEKTKWNRVVDLEQTAFQDGVLAEEAT